MYIMTYIVFVTLTCFHFSQSTADDDSGRIHVPPPVDRVVEAVQTISGIGGYKPAELTAGTGSSANTAEVVTPDYVVANPEPVQSTGSNNKVPSSNCCSCLNYVQDYCEG